MLMLMLVSASEPAGLRKARGFSVGGEVRGGKEFMFPSPLPLLNSLDSWFPPSEKIMLPNSSVNLVLHSRAVRKVLVNFILAMCSAISSHTTLLMAKP